MELKLSEADVARMVEHTLQHEFARQLQQSYSQIHKQFSEALAKAGRDLGPEIEAAVTLAVRRAVTSDQFHNAIRDEVIRLCSKKFAGAFDSVLKRAATNAARDEIARTAIKETVNSVIKN